MFRIRDFRKRYRNLRDRMVTFTVLGVYLFALVFLPVLHRHNDCATHDDTSASVSVLASDSCEFCKFFHLTVPLFTLPEQLITPSDCVSERFFQLSISPTIVIAGLPPCRAPPVI